MRAASSCLGVVAVAVAAIASSGCQATTYGAYGDGSVGYVELTAAPVDIEAYPHTYYDGRQVYYVNERWMYRDGGSAGPTTGTSHPSCFYRHRGYIQQAPPAYPYPRGYPQGYPHSYPRSYPQSYPPGYPR